MNNNKKHSNIQRVLSKVCAVLCAFVIMVKPNNVSALSPSVPIPPIWLPMNAFNNESIVPNAEILNDEQKEIMYEIIGAYNHIYLGFGGFILTNPIQGVKQWWREYGETFYNAFIDSINTAPRAIVDMVGSAEYKASQYTTLQQFENEVDDTTTTHYVEYNPELTFAFRDWYFNRGGVYQFQFNTEPFITDGNWRTNSYIHEGDAYVAQYNTLVRCNSNSNANYYNYRILSNTLGQFHNLFIDTVNHRGYLCDDNGTEITRYNYSISTLYHDGGSQRYSVGGTSMGLFGGFSYSTVTYTTVLSVAKAFFENVFNANIQYQFCFYSDFVDKVYSGANWAQKEEVYNIDDLNISGDISTYIDNIGNTGYTDITGLSTSLGEDIVDIRDGVIDNTLVKTTDGTAAEQLTDSLLKAIDKYMTTPKSGVIVPINIFAPVKGFMEYMWYMTKPLITFTSDILQTLMFGSEGDFLNTGPTIFIYGVVAFGLIGGLVAKCLL